jgi:hypothetical protein
MEVIVLPLTFVSGFAHDIAMRPNIVLHEKTNKATLENQQAA